MDAKNLDYKVLAKKLNMPPQRMRRRIGHFEKVFRDIDIKDKRILEIGAGTGLVSCFFGMAGAESVFALEPQQAGSVDDTKARFTSNIQSLGLKNISLAIETIQQYQAPACSFDLIVAVAVVNHLDEDACGRLGTDEKAVKTYQELFTKLLTSLKNKGQLILTDCSRKNAFSWLSSKFGIPNPSAPMIDWSNHQEPEMWMEILEKAGFKNVTNRWIFPTWRIPRLVNCSRINKVLDNFVFLYLTTSYFAIRACRMD